MSDIGNINPLTGANPAQARATPSERSMPSEPATAQSAVAPPLTAASSSVTQAPAAGNAEWQRETSSSQSQGQDPLAGPAPTRQQLSETVTQLNQHLRNYDTNLQFEIDDKYGEMVVRIVDRQTQEVVRQIPSEKVLALANFFKELQSDQGRRTAKPSNGKNSGLQVEGWLLRATA